MTARTCSAGLLAGCSVGLPAHAQPTLTGEMLLTIKSKSQVRLAEPVLVGVPRNLGLRPRILLR